VGLVICLPDLAGEVTRNKLFGHITCMLFLDIWDVAEGVLESLGVRLWGRR
jgi:hypothetical protein